MSGIGDLISFDDFPNNSPVNTGYANLSRSEYDDVKDPFDTSSDDEAIQNFLATKFVPPSLYSDSESDDDLLICANLSEFNMRKAMSDSDDSDPFDDKISPSMDLLYIQTPPVHTNLQTTAEIDPFVVNTPPPQSTPTYQKRRGSVRPAFQLDPKETQYPSSRSGAQVSDLDPFITPEIVPKSQGARASLDPSTMKYLNLDPFILNHSARQDPFAVESNEKKSESEIVKPKNPTRNFAAHRSAPISRSVLDTTMRLKANDAEIVTTNRSPTKLPEGPEDFLIKKYKVKVRESSRQDHKFIPETSRTCM